MASSNPPPSGPWPVPTIDQTNVPGDERKECSDCKRKVVYLYGGYSGAPYRCWTCHDKAAPFGYVICGLCHYERARGLDCGGPCV